MEAVPFIRAGSGRTPSDGGCIMQIVDWIVASVTAALRTPGVSTGLARTPTPLGRRPQPTSA